MEFSFTQEQEALRQTVRRFLDNESSEQIVRRLMETESGYDPKVWRRMAEELSLVGLAIPERFGGAGYGPVELAIVMEEMGRALYCGPYLATAVLAADALIHAAEDPAREPILREIASGRTIAALAIAENDARGDLETIAMRATRDQNGSRLDGVKNYVIDGQTADVLIVVARDGDRLALFRVEGAASGLKRTALPTLDLTRKLARLEFSGTPATRLSSAADIRSALSSVIARATAMLAAEEAGGARRCLEMSVEYAKTRLQFGRPIGSFQAIKHRCADLLVETEFARSAAYNAAWCATEADPAALAQAAHIAKSYCSEAFFHAAAANIQIHGGMGFTWEHPAHLYFKRARASSVLFGDPITHRLKLAASLGV